MEAGWYPDPIGRYDHRYFNGSAWTADVSLRGDRLVDALGIGPSAPVVAPTVGNGQATAALVLGVVGAGLGILFVLFFVAFPLGVLALIFGIVGLRRSRISGTGRPQAITGIVLGPIAIALSIVGLAVLWNDLADAVHQIQLGTPATGYHVDFTGCRLDGTSAVADGRLTNSGSGGRSFRLRVSFLPPGSSEPLATGATTVGPIAKGASNPFVLTTELSSVPVGAIRCTVQSVVVVD